MAKLVTAYYSKKTGKRVTDAFGAKNPNYVNVLTIDPNFLRGSVVKVSGDGMPINWVVAEAVKLSWNTYQAKLDARRKVAAAKKLTTKTTKKTTAKKTVQNVVKAAAKKNLAKVKKLAQPLPATPAPLI